MYFPIYTLGKSKMDLNLGTSRSKSSNPDVFISCASLSSALMFSSSLLRLSPWWLKEASCSYSHWFQVSIEKQPPLEFVKILQLIDVAMLGQMPTHDTNNCRLRNEKASWIFFQEEEKALWFTIPLGSHWIRNEQLSNWKRDTRQKVIIDVDHIPS